MSNGITKILILILATTMASACTHYTKGNHGVYTGEKETVNDEIANVSTLNGAPVVDAETDLDIDENELDAAIERALKTTGPNRFQVRFTQGLYNNTQGDFDFTKDTPALKGAIIKMEFKIPHRYKNKIRFMPDARDAIWIDFKQNTRGDSPEKAYPIGQSEFFNFIVSQNGRKLTVFNHNKTKDVYVYNLRFIDKNGNVHQFDPEVGNGGHGND